MADVEGPDDVDFKTVMGLGQRGMTLMTPRDNVAMQANQAQGMLQASLSNVMQGQEGTYAVDAMRRRGMNIGFQAPSDMGATERVKNGVARNTGQTKDKIYGGM